jgi:NADPH:quinone reductase-like Zn-dependent oxidoreductase
VPAEVRRIAPNGVDAVFDHLGPASVPASWRLLAPGGTLVAYGSASTLDDTGSKQLPVLKIVGRILVWNTLPNGRHAYFYNFWAGRRRVERFRAELSEDLTNVLQAMADGRITAQIAARFPLAEAADALRLAEAGGLTGKIVLDA